MLCILQLSVMQYKTFLTVDKGRGIKTTQDVDPGQELIIESPLAYTLTNSKYRGIRCDFCFSLPDRLFKCSKCQFVSYCHRKCQKGDWPLHKHECKCLRKVAPKQPPDICRLVSQLVFQLGSSRHKSQICELFSNRESVSNSRKEAFFTFGAVLYEYLKGFYNDLETMDLYGLLCKTSCNSFAITNAELNSLGTGVYAKASLMNHSCDPNCVAVFNGPIISIRTIKSVPEGEELTVAYISSLSISDVRQFQLTEGYMFTCTCPVCVAGKTDSLMEGFQCQHCCCTLSFQDKDMITCVCEHACPSLDSEYVNMAINCRDELQAMYNVIEVVPTHTQQKQLEGIFERAKDVLSPTNIALVQCYEVAMDGCVEQGDWRGAMQYSKKLEKPYQLFLSQFHPTIGLHRYKQGKLSLQLDNLREGQSYLEKALKVLCISHGRQHSLVKQLISYMKEVEQEINLSEEHRALEQMNT